MANDPREIRVRTIFEADEASARRVAENIRAFGTETSRNMKNVEDTTRRAADGIKVLGANISVGRLLGWAVGWTTVYRAINLVTGAVRDSISAAFEFDASLRNTNTIAKLTEEQLGEVRQAIKELSTDARAGFRPITELSQALYGINSAGIVGTKSLDVLRASAAASAAGLTDVATASGAIVSVLNAYGLAASQATRVSDVLFKTVEVGVPPFEQLGKTIGEVAATAAVAGVPVSELGLVWAATSRVLSNAALTTTSLNRLIISFLSPSEAMRNAVRQLGFDSADTMLRQLGLIGSMEKLHGVTGDNAVVIRAIFQDQRAFRAASILMANGLEVLTKAQRDWGVIGKETGSTQAALTEQLKSQRSEVSKLRAEWERFSIEAGEQASGPLAKLLGFFADFLKMRRESGGFGILGFGLAQRVAQQEALIQELRRQRNARTPSEISRGEALRSVRTIRPEELRGFRPPVSVLPQEPTLDELFSMFERHKALEHFDFSGEIRALGEILIPKVSKALDEARRSAERLRGTLGADAEETKDALREVEKHERELIRLEGDRVRLAKTLADEYRRQGELLERAIERQSEARIRALVLPADLAARIADLRVSGISARLSAGADPASIARNFAARRMSLRGSDAAQEAAIRAALAEAVTPEQRLALGEQLLRLIQAQTQAQANLNREEREAIQNAKARGLDVEISLLRQKLEMLQRLEALGIADSSRVEAVTSQLAAKELEQQLLSMSPEMLEGFIRLAHEELREIIDAMGREANAGQLEFLRTQATQVRSRLNAAFRAQQEPRPTILPEVDLFEQNARKAQNIVDTIIRPALLSIVSDAEGIASAALRMTLGLHGQIVKAWGAMGKDAAREFIRNFLDEYGRIPSFQKLVPALPGGKPGGGVININIAGVDISQKLSESAKQEIVSAVFSIAGDRAVQQDRRTIGAGAVA